MRAVSLATILIVVFVLWTMRRSAHDVPLYTKRLMVGGGVGFVISIVVWWMLKPETGSDLNIFVATLITVMFMTMLIGWSVRVQHNAATRRSKV